MASQNILEIIEENYQGFSAAQRDLADYIRANYKTAAFMNSVQLAQAAIVSNPTVIRFAKELGFKGYPEMQKHLQSLVQNELSSLERVSITAPEVGDDETTPGYNIFRHEIKNISNALKVIEPQSIKKAAASLMNSDRILIVGMRVSKFFADYVRYTMMKIHRRIYRIEEWTKDYEDMCYDSLTTVALVIVMPRYPNSTINIIKKLKRAGVPIIMITDSRHFPYADKASQLITVPIKYYSYVVKLHSRTSCFVKIFLKQKSHNAWA